MSRFTAPQIQEAYSRPYILPRRVTMVTNFQSNPQETINLLPTYEVRVAPNQNIFTVNHVKWIEVAAFNNRQPHALNVMNTNGIEALTEAWFEPDNARSFQSSVG